MKTLISLSSIILLALLLGTGCDKNRSNDAYSTNSVTDGTGGMMNTNLPPTNSVPDLNRNAPAGTNQ